MKLCPKRGIYGVSQHLPSFNEFKTSFRNQDCKKAGSLFLCTILIICGSNLTLFAAETDSSNSKPVQLFSKLSPIAFLRSAGGGEATVYKPNSSEIAMELVQGETLGIVMLNGKRIGRNTQVNVVFSSASGNILSFSTTQDVHMKTATVITFNNTSVAIPPASSDKAIANDKLLTLRLSHIFNLVETDPTLKRLTTVALPFLNAPSFRNLISLNFAQQHVTDCAVEATDCLMSVVAYGISMGALVSSCGFSFGAGCVGALLAHPIFGGAVAIYCGRAIESCGLSK